MIKQEFPFVDLDKVMGDFDMNDMLGKLNVPTVEMDKVLDIHRKNLEAVVSVNKMAVEGLQELARVQADMVKSGVTDFSAGVKDLAAGNVDAEAALKGDLVKSAVEKTVSNLREVSDVATKYNKDITDTIQTRVEAAIAEVKALGDAEVAEAAE